MAGRAACQLAFSLQNEIDGFGCSSSTVREAVIDGCLKLAAEHRHNVHHVS